MNLALDAGYGNNEKGAQRIPEEPPKTRGLFGWVDRRAEKIATKRAKREKSSLKWMRTSPVCAESVEYPRMRVELIVHIVEQVSKACVGLKENPLSNSTGCAWRRGTTTRS